MVEALRGLGYSPETALADLIDNCIAAQATDVKVQFSWAGSASTISIQDNGVGMDDGELELAMRLGAKDPLQRRAETDLGRFGLGLKTASFSQCRRLTVASRKAAAMACFRWDIDLLANSTDDGWYLMEGPEVGSERLIEGLEDAVRGTIVVWENLDRIITTGFGEQDFLDLIDRIEAHLRMVFHRYLMGPRPRFRIRINERELTPWDPFALALGTWSSPIAEIGSGDRRIEVQGHVLPHKDRIPSRDYVAAAGVGGWTARQGFYVYRNERLLVAGSWLGLGRERPWTKEEPYRLARIRLDLMNANDFDWKIDIRKSTARPPVAIREWLTRVAEDTRERARRVFAHRGQITRPERDEPAAQAWVVETSRSGVRYRINEDHPAVNTVLKDAGPLEPYIKGMLRVIEETIPVQRIWLDTVEAQETPRTGFSGRPDEEVKEVLSVMYRNFVLRRGMTPQEARYQLLRTEPFQNYPELVDGLPEQPAGTEGG